MTAPTLNAPSGDAHGPGKEVDPASLGAPSVPRDLGQWVHGKRLRVCLTPDVGEIHVHIAVPAHAMPEPQRYGLQLTDLHSNPDLVVFYPGGLTVDTRTNTLRGRRAPSPEHCPGYSVGFELELEPDMTAAVALAVRHCNTLARLMAAQEG